MAEKRKRQADHGVGYGRPPRQTRFKPGQSGNPKGRPRGRKNVATILEETLYRPVPITENGRRRRVPAIEAVLLGLLRKCLDGDLRAFGQIAKLMPMLQTVVGSAENETKGRDDPDATSDTELLAEFAEMVRQSGVIKDEERDDDQ